MVVVAASALLLTPFAWSPPEERWPLLATMLIFALMVVIVVSPYLLDRLDGGRPGLRPRRAKAKPLPRMPWPFTWPEPPHRIETTRL
jgi:hypothetical protein